jgi:hypothetical protein
MNLLINVPSSFIICNPHDSNALKKSVLFTFLIPSNDGNDLNTLGNVAIVFEPFSNNFCLYFDRTIFYIIKNLPSKYLFEYKVLSTIF